MVETGGLENRWPVTGPGGSNPSSSANLLGLTRPDARQALDRVLDRLDILSFEALRETCRATREAIDPAAMRRQLARLPPPPTAPADNAALGAAFSREVAAERALRAGQTSRFTRRLRPLGDAVFCGDDRHLIGAAGADGLTILWAELTKFRCLYSRPEPCLADASAEAARLAQRLSGDGRWLVWLPPRKQARSHQQVWLLDLVASGATAAASHRTVLGGTSASAGAPEVIFSPSSAHLALSFEGRAGARSLWDLMGPQPLRLRDMPALADLRGPAAFCPDGAYFAAAAAAAAPVGRAPRPGEVGLWPLALGQRGPVWLSGGLAMPLALAISRQAEKVVVLGQAQAHVWWQPLGCIRESRRIDLPTPGPADGVRSLLFPGRLLLSARPHGGAALGRLWLGELRGHHVGWDTLGLPACAGAGLALVSPWEGRWLLAQNPRGEVSAVDLGLSQVRKLRLPGLQGPLSQAAFTARGGDLLLLAISASGPSLWHLPARGDAAVPLPAPAWGEEVSAVAWLSRPGWAATGHRNGSIMLWPPDACRGGEGLWPAAGGAGVPLAQGLSVVINSLQVSRSGAWLYAGSPPGPYGCLPEGRVYRLYCADNDICLSPRAAEPGREPPAVSLALGS